MQARSNEDSRVVPPLLGDAPIETDLLGYEPFARTLAEFLSASELPTPYCVGIYGSWGTGKSSFMAMMRRHLSEAMSADHLLWFEPWLFDNKEEVWKALVYTTLHHLETLNSAPGKRSEQRADRIGRLLKGLGRVSLNATIGTVTQGLVNFDQLASMYAHSEHDATQFLNTFRHEFETIKDELLSSVSGEGHARLIIFVDDLDRCAPDSAITVLEAIKLFFDMRGCVFVLGIDRAVVQQGIELKYNHNEDISGERYLEKLVQLPFQLPAIEQETFERYLRTISGPLAVSDDTLRLVALSSEQNPRRAKRLLDCLHLLRTVAHDSAAEPNDSPLDENKLATLLVLQVHFPVVFLWLSAQRIGLSDLFDDEKAQAALIADLRSAYSVGEAGRIVERLRLFLTDEAVRGFSDRGELERYLRVSRMVESTPQLDPKPLIELLDRRMVREPEADPIETQGPEITPPEPLPPDTIASSEQTIEQLMARVVSLRDQWHSAARTSLFWSLSRNFRLLEQTLVELHLRRDSLMDEIDRVAVESGQELRDARIQASSIRPMHLASAARRTGAGSLLIGLVVATLPSLIVLSGWYRATRYGADIALASYLTESGWLSYAVFTILGMAAAARGAQLLAFAKRTLNVAHALRQDLWS